MESVSPLLDYVIIDPQTETETKAGILIPESGKEQPEIGVIIATGPGKTNNDTLMKLDSASGGGGGTNMTVKVGQKVLFKKYAAHEIKLNNKKLLITEVANIFAIINE